MIKFFVVRDASKAPSHASMIEKFICATSHNPASLTHIFGFGNYEEIPVSMQSLEKYSYVMSAATFRSSVSIPILLRSITLIDGVRLEFPFWRPFIVEGLLNFLVDNSAQYPVNAKVKRVDDEEDNAHPTYTFSYLEEGEFRTSIKE